jgi:hypothetical protein
MAILPCGRTVVVARGIWRNVRSSAGRNAEGESVKACLTRKEIDEAIDYANETYERWKSFRGHYPNKYNSHVKGKMGEIAVEKILVERQINFVSHFRRSKAQGLCDIELDSTQPSPRLDVKIWSLDHWLEQGRCVTPGQLPKLQKLADALVWTIVDLPDIKKSSDLDHLTEMGVEVAVWSTVSDVASTSIRPTGWRNIPNHQVEIDSMRSPELLFSL